MLFPEPRNERVVLLGAAGTGTAFGAATSLRRHWPSRVRLIGMDSNPAYLVTTSILSDAMETVPPSGEIGFLERLRDVIRLHGVDTYRPLVDEEILLAAEAREEGQLPGDLALMAPAAATARLCLDKTLLATWMTEHGIHAPRTAPAATPFEADTYFFKPRSGFGSRGARALTADELGATGPDERSDSIVQECCAGPEITVDVFRAEGFDRVVCRERLETKSGVCTKARVFVSPELSELAERLGNSLGIIGGFCFQVMRLVGEWAVIDINARPGAGTAICAAAGIDFFAAAFALAWGLDPRAFVPALEREVFVTRQYTEFIMT